MEEDDPLAQYRKTPKPKSSSPPENPRLYRAFDAQDKIVRLDIRRASGASHAPAYGYLLDIIYGSRFYTEFTLVFSFMTVTVKGRNLREIIQALRLGKCAEICEFHPELYDWPADTSPLIERIDIVTVGQKVGEN